MNHEFFWDTLCPVKDSHRPEEGSLLHTMICENFGGIDEFIEHFNARTATIQGSGWGWLCYNTKQKGLKYRTTLNQDLITDTSINNVPILNMDIWEHAYYLDYKNARPSYLNKMWTIINWDKVA